MGFSRGIARYRAAYAQEMDRLRSSYARDGPEDCPPVQCTLYTAPASGALDTGEPAVYNVHMARRSPIDPTRAVAYLRVSTDRQDLGPEAQRASILAWAAREGVEVVAWHEDRVSGASELDDRPALAAALADLRVHRAGRLVVAKRDRVARDAALAAMIDRAVEKTGARIVTADGVACGASPADAFMRSILDAAAAYELALIRERTRAALRAKRARGEASNHPPYGYRVENGRFVRDDAEQAVIAAVRDLRAEGVTLRAIVAILERRGVLSRVGTPLALTQVARIARAA